MKLSYECRCELRKKVEELLETVPYGQRIKLDEELLNELLFEKKQVIPEQYFKNTEEFFMKGFAKVPVWSGEFLRKIDLSKVSFEGVTWCASDYPAIIQQMNGIFDFNSIVDYSYTNANIDFSSSFDARDGMEYGRKVMYIINCNFSGVDLSNNDIMDTMIIRSNISNTNINLKNSKLYCHNSNLTNVSLVNHNIDINDFLTEDSYGKINICGESIFLNTKLNIVGNIDSLSEKMKNFLYDYIRNGKLNGCYLNGQLINGFEYTNGTHVRKNYEYEKMKEELFDTITQSIEEQKKSVRR